MNIVLIFHNKNRIIYYNLLNKYKIKLIWDFMNLINKNEIFLLEEIVKRNFSSKYKDSVLGIFWSVLKPLLLMIILTIVFSAFFKGMVENYPVYLLSGRCIFDFFSGAIGVSTVAIRTNKNILQKTPAPKYIFILGSVISEFLNFIITLIILLGVMVVTKNPFYLTIMPLSIIPIISLLIMIVGISLMLAIICTYYADIEYLWGVVSFMIMYASAIFYPMDIIPPIYLQFLSLNPVYWIIEQFRDFIAYGVIPNTMNMVNSLLLSVIILIIGIIIYKKYEKKVTLKL